VHTHKIRGKSPPGLHPKTPKRVFVTSTTRTFGHLSCTDFNRFWNRRRESVSACVLRSLHLWKISEFMRREFWVTWVLVGDVRFGRYKPTKRTNFGEISYFEFTKLHISTSLVRGRHAVLEPILQGVHRHLSSCRLNRGYLSHRH